MGNPVTVHIVSVACCNCAGEVTADMVHTTPTSPVDHRGGRWDEAQASEMPNRALVRGSAVVRPLTDQHGDRCGPTGEPYERVHLPAGWYEVEQA